MNPNTQQLPLWKTGYLPLILGGIGAMASALLMPWVTLVAPSVGTINQGGMATDAGKLFALGVVFLAFVGSSEARSPSSIKRLVLLVGVVVLAVGLFVEYRDITSMVAEVNGDFVHGEVGFGLYAMGIGLSATFVGILRRRSTWALLREMHSGAGRPVNDGELTGHGNEPQP